MSCRLFEDADHTRIYRLYRPSYPSQVFEHIINYYFNGKQTDEKIPLAIDIGCGNGQATISLSSFCTRVIGIDVSANQIAHGIKKDNIEYRCHKAEDLTFLESNSVDLITAAATIHWLNIELFFEEVKRVLKPSTGILAFWTYGAGTLDNAKADDIYQDFNERILLPYWNSKRHLAISYYESLLPLIPFKSTLAEYIIQQTTETSIGKLVNLIETFSASETFRKQEGEEAYQSLLQTLRKKLIQAYLTNENRNADQEFMDCNSIQVSISNPIRLYLIRKIEMD